MPKLSRPYTLFIAAVILSLGTAAVLSRPAHAQSAVVTISNFSFQPATLTVSAGTTVTWTNQDSVAHTSTSDTGAWSSGSLSTGSSFSHTFNTPGSYPYHCAIHPFMTGTIVVQSAATSGPSATAASTTVATPTTTGVAAPTATSTPIPMSASPGPSTGGLQMGPITMHPIATWVGYYDAHKDTYVSTDVSSKSEATAMHINFSAALARTPKNATPAIYLVSGAAAAHQVAVFGSEPGESDYSPLWRQTVVKWKSGAKKVLLTSDNQILALAKKGKLTVTHTNTVLNCPITKVGK